MLKASEKLRDLAAENLKNENTPMVVDFDDFVSLYANNKGEKKFYYSVFSNVSYVFVMILKRKVHLRTYFQIILKIKSQKNHF